MQDVASKDLFEHLAQVLTISHWHDGWRRGLVNETEVQSTQNVPSQRFESNTFEYACMQQEMCSRQSSQ